MVVDRWWLSPRVVHISRDGIYVIWRGATKDRIAAGFIVKPKAKMLFSERNGKWRGRIVGPLYVRSYARSGA